MDKPCEDGLSECRAVVEHLLEEKQEIKKEKQVLRGSAEAFGELAERLSTALKEGIKPENSHAGVRVSGRGD
jgi:hypothetical protein